jgi:hypothetical protein
MAGKNFGRGWAFPPSHLYTDSPDAPTKRPQSCAESPSRCRCAAKPLAVKRCFCAGMSSTSTGAAFALACSRDAVPVPVLDEFDALQTADLQRELFKQRKRLADAERTLLTKTTKAATESKRIATAKVEWVRGKLADTRRTELVDEDSRIFPGWYAPVMVMEEAGAWSSLCAISAGWPASRPFTT